ncbi:MAG: response regulator transcription factor [Dokdonella sp.]|nr:response regulator transcription factor [Dokdonella sp.]
MRVLLVDDEPLARERLAALLADIDGVEIAGMAGDGLEAVAAAERLRPDLVLLDIRMPRMDGLEAARHIGELEAAPAVVFCTAYDDHALAAFEANAVDYLLKPIRGERLRGALERARRFSVGTLGAVTAADAPRRSRSHLCARVRGSLVLVPVADVDYLLAEDKYVVVHHGGGEVLIEEPLKALETEFADRFVRIHRNCLVARHELVELKRGLDGHVHAILRHGDRPLEVSRRCVSQLKDIVKRL